MNRSSSARLMLLLVFAGLAFTASCKSFSREGGQEQSQSAAREGQGEETAYLFSSFGGERDGLLLAHSDDLYTWREIPGPHLKPTIGDNVMRDPFIMMGPDNTIHMVWTTGWGRRDIGYAKTRDLINWSEQKLIPVMVGKPKTRNCWAPKIFYDEAEKQWQIIWSTWLDDGTFGPPEKPHTSKQHRIFYVTTKDFENFSGPKLLFDPGYSCIDAYLLKDGKGYLLFFKDERYNDSEVFTPAHQNIRMARGKNPYGPFGLISEPITGKGPGKWHNEGPCAIKLRDEYFVFYDHHSGDTYFGAVVSRDLKIWVDVSEKMNFPKGFKHGSIIRVPKRIVANLLRRQNEETN